MDDNLFEDISDYLRKENEGLGPIFTEQEIEVLILAFAQGRGDQGFTEDELDALLKWCGTTRVSNTLIDLVLKGMALIGWDGEEPMFQISPLGKMAINGKD